MIQQISGERTAYALHTKNSSYVLAVNDTHHVLHLHYGRRINITSIEHLMIPMEFGGGCLTSYDCENSAVMPDILLLEMSASGKGDMREPFVEIVHADGSRTSDFLFERAEIIEGKEPFATLPGSYDDKGTVEHLCIYLKDIQYDQKLELHYYVYEDCDVITRSARLVNESADEIRMERMLSNQLDFEGDDWILTSFFGSWTNEMNRTDTPIRGNRVCIGSTSGTSSNQYHPFVMLHKPYTTEDHGDCYGLNLIYSGNHYSCASHTGMNRMRFVSGINPDTFTWSLQPGEAFEAPEAVMCYSPDGYQGMSHQMHAFVREHIVRGEWKDKLRPVLLNSWEANYFDISEKKLCALAKAGKEVGIELLVMDDGWFGTRDNDTQALGDWMENKKKLPDGLKGLADKINRIGLEFGIWVEPEMVNENSDLYRAHPDWAIRIPGKPHALGRNQMLLDLSNPDVQEYIIRSMSKVFSSANISYVKWDHNRIFSDYFSQYLPADRQGEVAHRYVCGFYTIMEALTRQFPHILFEGCASGGNRFDLGILCYFPQIWGSDNSDAICRANIQHGYSYGYPMNCVSAHVSDCPNHQTLRKTPLETRYAVASFGSFGYECNLCDMKKEELDAIKEQIATYKLWREVLQHGTFYRKRNENFYEWTCVSKDKKRAVGMVLQLMTKPHMPFYTYYPQGLDEKKKYHLYSLPRKFDVREFGSLINTIAPVHVKQDSLIHHTIAKFVKMDSEVEDVTGFGDALMYGGVHLASAFCGLGYNEKTRYMSDFGVRVYYMEETE
ncbi:MAG: alpha-galactosidase [bacterium]|nr:alpha-galactosidase [bacterium]